MCLWVPPRLVFYVCLELPGMFFIYLVRYVCLYFVMGYLSVQLFISFVR